MKKIFTIFFVLMQFIAWGQNDITEYKVSTNGNYKDSATTVIFTDIQSKECENLALKIKYDKNTKTCFFVIPNSRFVSSSYELYDWHFKYKEFIEGKIRISLDDENTTTTIKVHCKKRNRTIYVEIEDEFVSSVMDTKGQGIKKGSKFNVKEFDKHGKLIESYQTWLD